MYRGQPDQLLDLNWKQVKGPGSHFESAMSSMVPSRSPAAADGMTFHKLMGGSLPSAVDGASEQFRLIDVRLNSPNKLNLSMPKSNECLPLSGIRMPVSQLDQFSGQSYGHHSARLGLLGAEKLSRVSVLQIGLLEGRKDASAVGRLRLDINNGEFINGREEYSASDPAASEEVSSEGPSKKRKAPPKDKVMEPGIASSSIDPSNVRLFFH